MMDRQPTDHRRGQLIGATLGDTITKPHGEGGLGLSRITSPFVIAALMVAPISLTHRRAVLGSSHHEKA